MKSNIALLQTVLILTTYYGERQTSWSIWPTQSTPAVEVRFFVLDLSISLDSVVSAPQNSALSKLLQPRSDYFTPLNLVSPLESTIFRNAQIEARESGPPDEDTEEG